VDPVLASHPFTPGTPREVDRRLNPRLRFNRDRRAVAGDELAQILLTAPDAVSFDELYDRLAAAELGDVAGWLAHAIDRGHIEELEPDSGGARRFRLCPGGARSLAQARRRYDVVA
jgi:hypothetical protein